MYASYIFDFPYGAILGLRLEVGEGGAWGVQVQTAGNGVINVLAKLWRGNEKIILAVG